MLRLSMPDRRTVFLDVANAAVARWHQINPDQLEDELDHDVWPLLDTYFQRHFSSSLVYSVGAALYYLETLEEQIAAHLLKPGLYNEWLSALRAERFSQISTILRHERAFLQRLRLSPHAIDTDLFWLAFPNNIHADRITHEEWTRLMTLAPYSRVVQQYQSLGPLLLAHASPEMWLQGYDDPILGAEEGLNALAHDLIATASECYRRGTFH